MTQLQITLLIVGGIIFIISFFLPQGRKAKETEGEMPDFNKDPGRLVLERELEDAKLRIEEIVDETIAYAMEKSERAMDRISNEKMLAFGEYSDTVLTQIHKNQQEAVFLYDMLNQKHAALVEMSDALTKPVPLLETFAPLVTSAPQAGAEAGPRIVNEPSTVWEGEQENETAAEDAIMAPRNSNDIILEMHKGGESNIDIARQLGLGVSEVKLVIDLFEG